MSLLNRKAFTFAELALVMLIIGVIAMLTIPNLKKYTQRSAFEKGAQKAYLTFNEAVDQAIVDNGPPYKWGADAQQYVEKQLKIDATTGLTRDGMELTVSCTATKCDFTADINGPKKEPNIEGKDIFKFLLTFAKKEDMGTQDSDKVVPQGDAMELLKNNWRFTDALWNK